MSGPIGEVDVLGLKGEGREVEIVLRDIEREAEAVGRFAAMTAHAEEVEEGCAQETGSEDVPRCGDDEQVNVALLRGDAKGEVVA